MSYKYSKLEGKHQWIDTFFEIDAAPQSAPNSTDIIVPDCTPGLLYVEKGGCIRQKDGEMAILSPNSLYLFGQKTKAVQYQFDTQGFKAFGVKLKPFAIYQLLGCPAYQITNKNIKINTSLPSYAILEKPHLYRSTKIEFILSCLEDLTPKNHLQPSILLETLLQDIHQSNGNISIQKLAQKHHIGYKKIERLFKKHIGITPKLYARIIRFNHCVKYATSHRVQKLTDIAYQMGFFDQMHFIKETRHFTGKLPSELFCNSKDILEKEQVKYLCERMY